MAEPPPSPPPSQWSLPQLTPACYNKILGMGADNCASQYSRPNSEILSSTPLPTCEVGYSGPNGSLGVGPCRRVMPMSLPPYQAQIQHGTGVFHPARVSTEYRRANYNSINGRWIRQVGGSDDNGNCQNGRGENSSKGKEKKKNDVWMKKEEECRDPSSPHKNGSKVKKENKKKKINKEKNGESEKKKEEEECHVPNLPPGIVLPMEWPYPDSF